MRSFYSFFFKNLVGIYLSIWCWFGYTSMMNAIPDHVYLQEGQELALDQKLPILLSATEEASQTMAEVGDSTYQTLLQRRASGSCENLSQGEYTLTCYLFGVLPMKNVEVSVVQEQSVYASGHVVGIYGQTKGVLVLGTSPVETADGSYREPAENILFAGDYITAVNGETIGEKEELVECVNDCKGEPVILTLERAGESIDVSLRAVQAQNESGETAYMLGIWVKDDMAGIGTITYYDSQGDFGALGHGITDGNTKELLSLDRGRLYRADVIGIKKGVRGEPGELEGVIYYGSRNRLGTILDNTQLGIFGTLGTDCYETFRAQDGSYPVGYKQQMTEGAAAILTDVSGELCLYHINIDALDLTPADTNKGIRFTVDDPDLLSLTGGIVQGLSGSPILQNGRIVGAVTHVLVNDPTRGYGIFIENMLHYT